MSEQDKLDEAVEHAVEVAANKSAEKEIRELSDFESAIDETLATGYLDDTLTVTDADGVAQCWIPNRSPTWSRGWKTSAGARTCSYTPRMAWWRSVWWNAIRTPKNKVNKAFAHIAPRLWRWRPCSSGHDGDLRRVAPLRLHAACHQFFI